MTACFALAAPCDTVRMVRPDRRLLHLALLDASVLFLASRRKETTLCWFGHGPFRYPWCARLLEGTVRTQRFALYAFLATGGTAGCRSQHMTAPYAT